MSEAEQVHRHPLQQTITHKGTSYAVGNLIIISCSSLRLMGESMMNA